MIDLRVYILGCRVQGLGVQRSGFRVKGSKHRIRCLEIYGLELRAEGVGYGI
jgi:hypothetical protein